MHTKIKKACSEAGKRESILINADALFFTGKVLKFHFSVAESEKRVIRAASHVNAGMNMSSALSHNNISGNNGLSVGLFNTETFGFAVATILGRANSLFMRKKLQTESKHLCFLRIFNKMVSGLFFLDLNIIIVIFGHIHKLNEICLNKT